MRFSALKRHISEDEPFPFYIVTGDDSFIVRKAAEMLSGLIGGMPEFNLHVLSENNTAIEIVAACKTLPLTGGRVVVMVNNFTKDASAIVDYLKNPTLGAILVMIAPVLTKNLSALVKMATIIECDRLDEVSLKKWVKKRCLEYGVQINENAAARLVVYSDRQMSRLDAETKKLAAYKLGGIIELNDVEEVVAPSPEHKMYELGDAILAGRTEMAVKILKAILDSNPASYVISALYSHFRRTLYAAICKERETAEYLGVKEFAVSAARRQAAGISPKKLKELCDRLQRIDYDFKTGRINDVLAAQTFVAHAVIELSELR